MLEEKIEYENVKRELEISLDVVRKADNSLYIGVTAVLAWSVTTLNGTLSLLVYCVIIPLYFIALNYNIHAMKLGAYLLVFHNDRWEKRLHKINNKKNIKRYALSYRTPFIYASIASTALFFVLFDYDAISILKAIQAIICISLFLGFNTYVFWQKDNDTIKQIYIEAWSDIKKED